MSNSPHSGRNILIGVVAILLAAGVTYWMMSNRPDVPDADDSDVTADKDSAGGPQIGAVPYQLVDMNGGTLTQDSFPGKYKLVFFGYSSCPDECPLALHTMADALKKLGPDAAKVQVIFISVDSKRDTPAVLKKYLAGFDARIMGATGTEAQVKTAEDSFHAYASDSDDAGGNAKPHKDSGDMPGMKEEGDISHSDTIYLLSPQNGLLNVFGDDVDAASLANDIETVLAAALIPADDVPPPAPSNVN